MQLQSLMILWNMSQRDVNPKIIIRVTFKNTFHLQIEVNGMFRY